VPEGRARRSPCPQGWARRLPYPRGWATWGPCPRGLARRKPSLRGRSRLKYVIDYLGELSSAVLRSLLWVSLIPIPDTVHSAHRSGAPPVRRHVGPEGSQTHTSAGGSPERRRSHLGRNSRPGPRRPACGATHPTRPGPAAAGPARSATGVAEGAARGAYGGETGHRMRDPAANSCRRGRGKGLPRPAALLGSNMYNQ